MSVMPPMEQTLRLVLIVGVVSWAQAVPSYSQLHSGLSAAVVGALGFIWGLVAIGYLVEKLR